MSTTFDVLAEPHRRQILDLLRNEERGVGELARALGVSQPAVSKHLRVLRDAGLVEVRVDAQRRLYSLRPEPLREVDAWLAPYRRLRAPAVGPVEEQHRVPGVAALAGSRAARTELWHAYYLRRNATVFEPARQPYPVPAPAALAH
jgi:DNA-binding transcriptional ArsR family regulator